MPLIHAEFDALSAFEELAKQTEQRFRQTLADLDRDLSPMQSQWSGAARDAYAVVRADWFAAASEIHAAIADLHRHVATARTNYQRAVATNVSIWRH